MAKQSGPKLDVRHIPFSAYGSYYSLSRDKWDNPIGKALYLRTVHSKTVTKPTELFRLDLLKNGKRVASREVVKPELLTLKGKGKGEVSLCLPVPGTVRARGEGAGLRLEVPPQCCRIAYPLHDGRWVLIPSTGLYNYVLEATSGTLKASAPWHIPNERGSARCGRTLFRFLPGPDGNWEGHISEFKSKLPTAPKLSFAKDVQVVREDWREWLKKMPKSKSSAMRRDWETAAYCDWSAVVPAGGVLTRPAMYMNKAHMKNVWSWDHCFNAMALSYGHPELAWDQLMLMADMQDENGFMPDSINDAAASWHHGKPPIHGWALNFCMERNPEFFTKARVREAHDWLTAWTNWWLRNRTWPGLGLPYYTHGNDSGWDNSTIFDVGSPTASPDLAAHLALQMEVVSKLAERLGKKREAQAWRKKSDAMLRKLVKRLWRGDRFVGIYCPKGTDIECESLITCIPLVLGSRLPADIQRALVKRLKRFITRHSLATEAPDSPKYSADFHAYWRGAVWAPPVMLIVDGLRDIGEEKLVQTISKRYCRSSAGCFYRENFHALTGEGLMDFAYTWTSSVYMILAHEYV